MAEELPTTDRKINIIDLPCDGSKSDPYKNGAGPNAKTIAPKIISDFLHQEYGPDAEIGCSQLDFHAGNGKYIVTKDGRVIGGIRKVSSGINSGNPGYPVSKWEKLNPEE